MSSGDFAAELDQSVREHIDAVRDAAAQAKARIGESAGSTETGTPEQQPARQREAAVTFDDVPPFDDGAPMWEDAP